MKKGTALHWRWLCAPNGVANEGDAPLSALVEPGERLAEPEDLFVGGEFEGGGGALSGVARAAQERERDVWGKRLRFPQALRAREPSPVGVQEFEAPWIAGAA
jgi:hypothetical protein